MAESKLESARSLIGSVCLKLTHYGFGNTNGASAAIAFRNKGDKLAPHLLNLLSNMQGAPLEIEVAPTQAANLGSA